MAISLPPQTTTTVVPEYAATNIIFNRQIHNIAGVLTAVYNASVSYERKDYIVDSNGVKVGLITLNNQNNEELGMNNDPTRGNINLTQDETMLLFSKMPEAGKVLGEVIADEADALIHAHLITRGIISA
jgi:hypothetical protein